VLYLESVCEEFKSWGEFFGFIEWLETFQTTHAHVPHLRHTEVGVGGTRL